jgi:hypothetical protein
MINAAELDRDLDALSVEDFILKYNEEDQAKLASAVLYNYTKVRGVEPSIEKPSVPNYKHIYNPNSIPVFTAILERADDKCIRIDFKGFKLFAQLIADAPKPYIPLCSNRLKSRLSTNIA